MKTKITSFILTSIIIGMLVMLGPASAVKLDVSQIDDSYQGDDIVFSTTVELSTPDQYLPIRYAELYVDGPDGFHEVCEIYNDGSYKNCNLDLDVHVLFNVPYAYGPGFGIDENNNTPYFFNEGYGYGYAGAYTENPEIVYNITWHTDQSAVEGEYKIQLKLIAIGDDQYEQYNAPYSYCGVMEGMFLEALVESHFPDDGHGSDLDLNQDGIVDLRDLAIFSGDSELRNNSYLFGMFKEYFRHQVDSSINEKLDLNQDGVVDGADYVIFYTEYTEEEMCANAIALIAEGTEHAFESDVETFMIEMPVKHNTYRYSFNKTLEMKAQNPAEQPEESTTQTSSSTVKSSTDVREEGNAQQAGTNKNVLQTITGAVTGAGSSLGLSNTLSYIFSLLLIAGIVFGSVRYFKRF